MASSRPTGSVRFENKNRVVIVTGGSMGIGEAIVSAFAASGAHVIIADVAAPESNKPPNVSYQRCDTASQKDCDAVVQHAISSHGAIDVLVNNAAIQPRESYRPIDGVPESVWQRMIDVNLCGYMRMASCVLPKMKYQESGVVINVASGQAHRTAREVGIYGPIKSANVMQARQWGIEYARDGIRVLSVSPGAIDTPMIRASLDEQGGSAALANRHPIGRIGTPQEVADAVLWLTSSAASFVTATDLEVDGGLGALGAFADPYPMTE